MTGQGGNTPAHVLRIGQKQYEWLVAAERAKVHPSWPFVGTHYRSLRTHWPWTYRASEALGLWRPGQTVAAAVAAARPT